jgi:hypothetical protein
MKFKHKKPKNLYEAIATVDWDRLIETCDKMSEQMSQLVVILSPKTKVQTIVPELLNPTPNEN